MTQINISDLQVVNADFNELSDLEREAIIGGTKSRRSSFSCAPAPVVCAPVDNGGGYDSGSDSDSDYDSGYGSDSGYDSGSSYGGGFNVGFGGGFGSMFTPGCGSFSGG